MLVFLVSSAHKERIKSDSAIYVGVMAGQQ
jgi:hypothetical protein